MVLSQRGNDEEGDEMKKRELQTWIETNAVIGFLLGIYAGLFGIPSFFSLSSKQAVLIKVLMFLFVLSVVLIQMKLREKYKALENSLEK